jgi:hypothetical protein
VPYFQVWWDLRVSYLKRVASTLFDVINEFWDTIVSNFREFLVDEALPNLKREEITDIYENTTDGSVVEVLRGLENAGHDVAFWEPGPSQAILDEWNSECDGTGCADDYLVNQGYDGLDYTIDQFKSMLGEFGEFLDDTRDRTTNWRSWRDLVYRDREGDTVPDDGPTEPDETLPEWDYSYNMILNRILYGDPSIGLDVGITGWYGQIEAVRSGLAACTIDAATGLINNYPCQTSIDADIDDEFAQARHYRRGQRHHKHDNYFSAGLPGFV